MYQISKSYSYIFFIILFFSIIIHCQPTGFELGSNKGFYTYNEVSRELDSMKTIFPNLITEKKSIGQSWEGNEIYMVKISDNVEINESEPEIFYNSLIHGVEPLSMMSLIYYMYYLLDNYETEQQVKYIVDNRELYFILIVNPDGYFHNTRKNRRDNGDGSIGVDLNRNFGYKWGIDDEGSSPSPTSHMYRGPEAFSEPESKAIRDFCNNHEFVIANNIHYYGYWVYYSWGYNLAQTLDSTKFINLGNMITELNSYVSTIPINIANGNIIDWMYGSTENKPKIFAYITEVGGHDISVHAPSAEDILKVCEENVYQNLIMAWGNGIIKDYPSLKNTEINKSFYIPGEDTIIIKTNEFYNEQETINDIFAILINDESTGVDTVHLSIIGRDSSNIFVGSKLINLDESFYRLKLEHFGENTPFKFSYYSSLNRNRFTTAGPPKLGIQDISQAGFKDYKAKFNVTNLGISKSLESLEIKISSKDSSITNIYPGSISMWNIAPGETKLNSLYVTFDVGDEFIDKLNFNFDIYTDNFLYWTDSLSILPLSVNNLAVDSKETFKLSQNYPNPFNPSTTISYSIPKQDVVELKVFDVLGREVSTLVNKEQTVGNYEVEFNVTHLTSGIYFYRIQAADFVETKKMILMK